AAAGQSGAIRSSPAEHTHWWRDVPVWAQVAAALLFLGVSAGIANLDVRYDHNGVTVRTGWSRVSTAPPSDSVAQRAGAPGSPGTPGIPGTYVPWRSELAALEQQLRAEMRAVPPADAPRVDGADGADGADGIVQRVSAAERSKQIADERANVESRYQIGQMERVLEGAVEHGATITRDRLKSVLPPGDTLMNGENARARGLRLEGYGVF